MRKPGISCVLSLIIAGTPAQSVGDEMPSASSAGFYAVDDSGRSAPDDPVASGFARAPDRSPGRGPPVQAAPGAAEPRPVAPRRVVIEVRGPADRAVSDAAAAWRCESAGFFYTSQGRCVAPAYRRPALPPPRAPRAPRWP